MTYPANNPTAPMLAGGGSSGAFNVRYRTGLVVAWNSANGANTIRVDGVERTNLPVVPGAAVVAPRAGDPVSLLAVVDDRGVATYLVTGVPITPPDPRLAVLSEPAPPSPGGDGNDTLITRASYTPTITVPGGSNPSFILRQGDYTRLAGTAGVNLYQYSFLAILSAAGTGGAYRVDLPTPGISSASVFGSAWVRCGGTYYTGFALYDGVGLLIYPTGNTAELGPSAWPGGSFSSGDRFGGTIVYPN